MTRSRFVKISFIISILIQIGFESFGQIGNEWYNSSQSYFKFKIGQKGIYRLDGIGLRSLALTNSLPQILFPILFQPLISINSSKLMVSVFLSPEFNLVVSSMDGISCVEAKIILLPLHSVINENRLPCVVVSMMNRFT